MQKKLILALVATAVVAAALVGVALAQFVGAQTQNSTAPQLIQLPSGQYIYGVPANVNGTLVYPCYPYGAYSYGAQAPQVTQQAPASIYGYGSEYGRGMCGRFW
jgi:hypothetical protein